MEPTPVRVPALVAVLGTLAPARTPARDRGSPRPIARMPVSRWLAAASPPTLPRSRPAVSIRSDRLLGIRAHAHTTLAISRFRCRAARGTLQRRAERAAARRLGAMPLGAMRLVR